MKSGVSKNGLHVEGKAVGSGKLFYRRLGITAYYLVDKEVIILLSLQYTRNSCKLFLS